MRLFCLWILSFFVFFLFFWLLAKERRCAAEVNAHRQEDGDIEHTQKKYISETDTHVRKN